MAWYKKTGLTFKVSPIFVVKSVNYFQCFCVCILEMSVAECDHQDAHVIAELFVVEHLAHLRCILSYGLVNAEPLLRALQRG